MDNCKILETATIEQIIDEIDRRIDELSKAKDKALDLLDLNFNKQPAYLSVRIDQNIYRELKQFCNKHHMTISSILKNQIYDVINTGGKQLLLGSPNIFEYSNNIKSLSQHKTTKTIAIAIDNVSAQHIKFFLNEINMSLADFVLGLIGRILDEDNKDLNLDVKLKIEDCPIQVKLLNKIGDKQYVEITTPQTTYNKLKDLDYENKLAEYVFDVGQRRIKIENKIINYTWDQGPKNTFQIGFKKDDWNHFNYMCNNFHVIPSICLINGILDILKGVK